jgi:hypothetical protein
MELEYKRKLWSDPLGGILGILGFRYRHERQDFEGNHRGGAGLTPMNVDLDEDLKEHLFGPFAGIGVSFKPAQDSRLGIHITTKVGYFFKEADLRARDVMLTEFGLSRHALNDDSSEGSFFGAVALGFTYALARNWSVAGDFGFDYINRATHIENNTVFPARPTKLVNAAVNSQSVGLKVLYKF